MGDGREAGKRIGKKIISKRGSGADKPGRNQATRSMQNRDGSEKEKVSVIEKLPRYPEPRR